MRNGCAVAAMAVVAALALVFGAIPALAGGVIMMNGDIHDDVQIVKIDKGVVVWKDKDGETQKADIATVRAVVLADGPIDWAALLPQPASPESVVNKAMTAIKDHDVEALLATISTTQREEAREHLVAEKLPPVDSFEIGEVVYGDHDGTPMAAVRITVHAGEETDEDWAYTVWEDETWRLLLDPPEGVDVESWRGQQTAWQVYSSAVTLMSAWQADDIDTAVTYLTDASAKAFREAHEKGELPAVSSYSIDDIRIGDGKAAAHIAVTTGEEEEAEWLGFENVDGVWKGVLDAEWIGEAENWKSYADVLFPKWDTEGTPDAVVKKLFEAEMAKDIEAFLGCLDAASREELGEDLTAEHLGNVASFEIGETTYNEDGTASVEVTATGTDEEVHTRTFVLVFEEDGWKISIKLSEATEPDGEDEDGMDDDEEGDDEEDGEDE